MYFAVICCKIDMYYVVHGFLFSEQLGLSEREFLDPACSCPVKTEFRKAVCWVDEALYLMEGGVGEEE